MVMWSHIPTLFRIGGNFFNHVLHVCGFHDIWKMDIRTAVALVPE